MPQSNSSKHFKCNATSIDSMLPVGRNVEFSHQINRNLIWDENLYTNTPDTVSQMINSAVGSRQCGFYSQLFKLQFLKLYNKICLWSILKQIVHLFSRIYLSEVHLINALINDHSCKNWPKGKKLWLNDAQIAKHLFHLHVPIIHIYSSSWSL